MNALLVIRIMDFETLVARKALHFDNTQKRQGSELIKEGKTVGARSGIELGMSSQKTVSSEVCNRWLTTMTLILSTTFRVN